MEGIIFTMYLILNLHMDMYRCGNSVLSTLEDPHVASYLHGTTLTSMSKNAKLFQVGSLRKVINYCYLKEV